MQNRMPLVEAMLKYKNEKVYPFHTPGHKGGRGMEALLKNELGAGAVEMDVSLMSELDDIHAPSSYIMEAQNLAAQLYGSDRCFFAVNGTTGAIHAMLMAACKAGDKVLVPRNAHRSVAGALLLANLEPVLQCRNMTRYLALTHKLRRRRWKQCLRAMRILKPCW